jgi:quinol monooxygenase YgiN
MASNANNRIYVVTRVDIMPKHTEEGAELLRRFGSQSSHLPGTVRFEIIREPSRPNHFTIVSVWENQAAFEAHLSAEATRAFRASLQPMLGSPFDERLHTLLG